MSTNPQDNSEVEPLEVGESVSIDSIIQDVGPWLDKRNLESAMMLGPNTKLLICRYYGAGVDTQIRSQMIWDMVDKATGDPVPFLSREKLLSIGVGAFPDPYFDPKTRKRVSKTFAYICSEFLAAYPATWNAEKVLADKEKANSSISFSAFITCSAAVHLNEEIFDQSYHPNVFIYSVERKNANILRPSKVDMFYFSPASTHTPSPTDN